MEKSGQSDYYEDNKPGAASSSSSAPRKAKSPKPKIKSSKSSGSGRGTNSDMGMLDELEIDANIFGGEDEVSGGSEADNLDKQYKDRFNYASFDCAATILKTNKEAKGASNILGGNKDSYMLNKCSAPKKFVIVELCQDILVDTVAIGAYEFFSSMFRHIRISVADRYPVPEHEWKVLGDFEARSVRDLQYFHIKNPLIWTRYIRVEFLSHWGHEFYCPVSVLRVYGTTMMEEYKKAGQGTSNKKSTSVSASNTNIIPGTISEKLLQATLKNTLSSPSIVQSQESSKVQEERSAAHQDYVEDVATVDDASPASDHSAASAVEQNASKEKDNHGDHHKPTTQVFYHEEHPLPTPSSSVASNSSLESREDVTSSSSIGIPTTEKHDATQRQSEYEEGAVKQDAQPNQKILDCLYVETAGSGLNDCRCGLIFKSQSDVLEILMGLNYVCDEGDQLLVNKDLVRSAEDLEEPLESSNDEDDDGDDYDDDENDDEDDDEEYNNDDGDDEDIPAVTQESVFQTIMKRISLLESNATLSMKYVESQTQGLLEQVVLLNAEHDSRVTQYVSAVNASLTRQLQALDDFRGNVVSVVIAALNEQRVDRVANERIVNEHLLLLSNDLRHQKQIAILQGIALLVVLLFVIVTRGASIDAATVVGENWVRQRLKSEISRSNSGSFMGSGFNFKHKAEQQQQLPDPLSSGLSDSSKGDEIGMSDAYQEDIGTESEGPSIADDDNLLLGDGEDNDYSYTNNDIETWRRKMASRSSAGRWIVSPSSPLSLDFELEEDEDDGENDPMIEEQTNGERDLDTPVEDVQYFEEDATVPKSLPVASNKATGGGLETIQELNSSETSVRIKDGTSLGSI